MLTATQLNAVSHIAQSLGRQLATERAAGFVDYVSASGDRFLSLSTWPLILMQGKPTKMWSFYDALSTAASPHAAFVDTMTSGGSALQVANTAKTLRDDLELIAVAGFGTDEFLAAHTKRFSLWREPSHATRQDTDASQCGSRTERTQEQDLSSRSS